MRVKVMFEMDVPGVTFLPAETTVKIEPASGEGSRTASADAPAS